MGPTVLGQPLPDVADTVRQRCVSDILHGIATRVPNMRGMQKMPRRREVGPAGQYGWERDPLEALALYRPVETGTVAATPVSASVYQAEIAL